MAFFTKIISIQSSEKIHKYKNQISSEIDYNVIFPTGITKRLRA